MQVTPNPRGGCLRKYGVPEFHRPSPATLPASDQPDFGELFTGADGAASRLMGGGFGVFVPTVDTRASVTGYAGRTDRRRATRQRFSYMLVVDMRVPRTVWRADLCGGPVDIETL